MTRLGRKARISAGQRDALWPLFQAVRDAIAARGETTIADMFDRISDRHGEQRATRPSILPSSTKRRTSAWPRLVFSRRWARAGRTRCSSPAISASAFSRRRFPGSRSDSTSAAAPQRFGSTTAPRIRFAPRPTGSCRPRFRTWTAMTKAAKARFRSSTDRLRRSAAFKSGAGRVEGDRRMDCRADQGGNSPGRDRRLRSIRGGTRSRQGGGEKRRRSRDNAIRRRAKRRRA